MVVNHFRFTVDGQPVSWNASYRMRQAKVTDKHGQPVLGNDLRQKTISRMFKTDEARAYQDGVQMIAQAAKPSGFAPPSQIIIGYQFRLGRALDMDNAIKMLNDAIAKALGVNDSRFLPVTLSLETGSSHPSVTIFVFDADHWMPVVVPNE